MGTRASIYLAIRLPICMHIPCDLSIYLHTQVLLPRADDTVTTRAVLRAAPPPLPTLADMIASMSSSSSPLFPPPVFQPASESSSTCAAEPVRSQPLHSEVSSPVY